MKNSLVLAILGIVQVCLWTDVASATCTLRMDFLEANYDSNYLNDPKDNSLCVGKADGFYANVGQCVPDFYGCVGGTYFALTCDSSYGPGYVYDPIRCACVPYADSACKTTLPTTQNAPGCSGKEDGSYPIGNSCGSTYFMCIDGLLYPQSCPVPNSVFDPSVSACVSADKAQCNKNTTGTAPTSSTNSVTTSSLATDSNSQAVTTNPSPISTDSTTPTSPSNCTTSSSFSCPANSFENFPIEGGVCCNNYYQCIAGSRVVTNCPPGLAFNPSINDCDSASNVATCPAYSLTTAAVTSPTGSSFVCPSTGTFSIPGTCSGSYYSCLVAGGIPETKLCDPRPDLNFYDCTLKACTAKTSVQCFTNPGFVCPAGTQFLLPDGVEQAQPQVQVQVNQQTQQTESRWTRFIKWLNSF